MNIVNVLWILLALFSVFGLWQVIVASKKESECICIKVCDCENPPPKNWDGKNGVYHVSEECPIHNSYDPDPNPDCKAKVHGPFLFNS
jgi:hypothetical protein